jgi:hypothetical protein
MVTLVFGAVFALAFLLLLPGSRRSFDEERKRQVSKSAGKLREELEAVFGGEHEYARVDPAELPFLDLEFYDAAAEALEELGFKRVADIEDLTLSRANPNMRTFTRAMIADSGLIRATIFHLRPTGAWMWVLQMARVVPRHIKCVELTSEAPIGKFLVTTPTQGVRHLSTPDAFAIERHARGTPIEDLLERHRERLTRRITKDQNIIPVYVAGYDELIASFQRANITVSRHRQKLGGLTREELEQIAQRPLRPSDHELLEELDRQRRDDDDDEPQKVTEETETPEPG